FERRSGATGGNVCDGYYLYDLRSLLSAAENRNHGRVPGIGLNVFPDMYGRILRRIKPWFLTVPVGTGLLFFAAPPIFAAPLPVATQPTRFDVTASRGERLTATVHFWNGTDTELPVHMESEDIRPQDEEGHVAGEAEEAVNSLKAWIKPIYPDVVVFPKQEIALDFTI